MRSKQNLKFTAAFLCLSLLPMAVTAQGPPNSPGTGLRSRLVLSPSVVVFNKTGSETTLTRTVDVRLPGLQAGLVTVTTSITEITGGVNWLSVGAIAGGKLALTATPGSLPAGVYTAQVNVSTAGGPVSASQNLTVFLRVLPASNTDAAVFVRPSSLEFRMMHNGAAPPQRTLHVSSPNAGAGFTWTAAVTAGASWLSILDTAGAGPAIIRVQVNGAGLAPGTHTGTVTVMSGGASVNVPVTLHVVASAGVHLVAVPAAFNFIVHPNAPAPAPKLLYVRTTGGGSMDFQVSAVSDGNWLQAGPALAGASPATLEVGVNAAGMAPGHYQGTITITSGEQRRIVRVFLRILAGAPSQPARPVGEAAVQISPRALRFVSASGTVTPAAANVELTSALAALTYRAEARTVRGGAWLNVTPAQGSINGSLTVTVNATGLAPGVYGGAVVLHINGAVAEERVIPVTLRVDGAAMVDAHLLVRPGGVRFSAAPGGPNPPATPVRVEVRGQASVNFETAVSTGAGGNWLSVAPTSGSAPTEAQISVNAGALQPGVYRGTVVFRATGDARVMPATLRVHLVIRGEGQAGTPTISGLFIEPAIEFRAAANAAIPVKVALLNANGQAVNNARVLVSSSSDDTEVELEPTGDGTYVGQYLALKGGPMSLAARAIVQGQAAVEFGSGGDVECDGDAPPAIFARGVVSTASYAHGATPLAPGSIVSIFGKGLVEASAHASTTPLPRTLGGIKVLVGGHEAPLIAVIADAGSGYDQINLQVPFEVSGKASVDVVVVRGDVVSSSEAVAIAPGVPALFTANQGGSGPVAALHADYTAVTAANAAKRGRVISLFATGLGQVQPHVRTGEPPSNLTHAEGNIEVRIGGRSARVDWAGHAPLYPGLYQINVEVPADAPSGSVEVSVSVNGTSSEAGTTIYVE